MKEREREGERNEKIEKSTWEEESDRCMPGMPPCRAGD